MKRKTILVLLLVSLFCVSLAIGGYWVGATRSEQKIESLRQNNSVLNERYNESIEEINDLQDMLVEKNESILGLKNEIAELNKTVQNKKDVITDLKNRVGYLGEVIERKNASLEEAKQEIVSLKTSLENKNNTITELRNNISVLREKIDSKNEEISYLSERNSRLSSLLTEANESLDAMNARINNLTARVDELSRLVNTSYVVDESSFGALAVENETGEGVVLGLETEYEVGDGELNLDIVNTTYGETYMQSSFRTALEVSTQISEVSLSNRSIDQQLYLPNTSLKVSGPSAGAAICLAQISVFENKTINQSILITGTINPDGSIGRVGSVRAKVVGAREDGYEVVLVPDGQYVDVDGIVVREVSDIWEAGDILFKEGM